MYPAGRANRKYVHDYHISIVKSDPRAKYFLQVGHIGMMCFKHLMDNYVKKI
jgi:hypothetical protein